MKPLRKKRLERLVDAEPTFYDWIPDRNLNPHLSARPDRRGVGIMFACPIHDDCHIAVQFKPALDGGGPLEPDRNAWDRSGDTFETLTLSPSIRVLGGVDGCKWHGFIRQGRFEHCSDSR